MTVTLIQCSISNRRQNVKLSRRRSPGSCLRVTPTHAGSVSALTLLLNLRTKTSSLTECCPPPERRPAGPEAVPRVQASAQDPSPRHPPAERRQRLLRPQQGEPPVSDNTLQFVSHVLDMKSFSVNSSVSAGIHVVAQCDRGVCVSSVKCVCVFVCQRAHHRHRGPGGAGDGLCVLRRRCCCCQHGIFIIYHFIIFIFFLKL